MSNSHLWKRSGAQDMTISPDLPVLDVQVFQFNSKIIDLEVQIRIFEIISKIWIPNQGFLKYFQKSGGPTLIFLKYFQKHEVQLRFFLKYFIIMEVTIVYV